MKKNSMNQINANYQRFCDTRRPEIMIRKWNKFNMVPEMRIYTYEDMISFAKYFNDLNR